MINCIAVDDEPLALDIVENYIKRIPELNLLGRFNTASQASEFLKNNAVDLLFVDIQMPGVSGIQFVKNLADAPMVIFTTAYENYALESYELDVMDYLLKPIPFSRFEKAIQKVKDYYDLQKNKITSLSEQYIFVRSEYQLLKISLDDIVYIEGLKDYVKIYCGPKPIFSHQNLKSIEGKLPSDRFIRVHKSYIVAIHKIESLQKTNIKIGGQEIPIGETYKNTLSKLTNSR